MIENSQLLELIGKTKTQNLLDDISKEYFELQIKKYPDYSISKALSIISITKPNETEIEAIGMSCINDLLTDQWGIFLRGILSSNATITINDEIGTPRTVQLGGGISGQGAPYNVTNNPAGQVGSACQVGTSAVPPTRQDVTINAPFGVAPESNKITTGNGGYNAGLSQIDIPCQISPTGGAGVIAESCLFCRWHTPSDGNRFFCISHDVISPTVSFIIGKTINIDYKIQLS